MEKLDLTALERRMLERSDNPHITQRRRTIVIATGLSFAALLTAMAVATRSWPFVLGVALLYIGITVWEKVAYADAVLAYKSLIRKLNKRIEERESK